MNFQIELESKSFNIELKTKSNIKHTYIKIIDSENIKISANKYFTFEDAMELIKKREQWILKHCANFKNRAMKADTIYYLGEIIDSKDIPNVDEFYMQKAKEILPKLVEKNSKIMNLFPTALKYRKNKTRLGSCSYRNSINLNILLMRYPLDAIEYVVIHELAHIKHKNHSKKFWSFVEIYSPEYKKLDSMLKLF